ncbi:hypothetical protein BJX61DRAFT_478637 [Aspergillus egyptiacus]|nr:hypothetical protein BJX61DRAFT_478637 [Aspergillus egyptiacus]
MTSTFSFGFSGDDIDVDDVEIGDTHQGDTLAAHNASGTPSLPELVPAKRHDMSEWLSILPSQITYNKFTIRPSQDTASGTQSSFASLTVARRDVFDIRAQLMAEDSAEEENGELIAGLEKGDITPHFYEGGFKTWECSIDLASLIADEGMGLEGEDMHIVELGAGTAVPSLALFAKMLAQTEADPAAISTSAHKKRRTLFTFADYNSAVLRLVTLPNLLLTWNHFATRRHLTPTPGSQTENANKTDSQETEEEILDITPDLLTSFQTDIANRGITISFISGAWSPSFVDLVFSSAELAGFKSIVLASETIYSPGSLGAFSETLLALLRRSAAGSRALIAAKKVYFGVGGGVDEFLVALRGVSGGGLRVEERLDIKSAGVGRVILEIGVDN